MGSIKHFRVTVARDQVCVDPSWVVCFELFKRWIVYFDFAVSLSGSRYHSAPNGDWHEGAAAGCTHWPCVDHEAESASQASSS